MMVLETPYITYAAIYIVSVHIISCNSRTSAHWKINIEQGKVVTADLDEERPAVSVTKQSDDIHKDVDEDLAFSIITSCNRHSYGEWSVDAGDDQIKIPPGFEQVCKSSCNNNGNCCEQKNNKKLNSRNSSSAGEKLPGKDGGLLDCGKIANFTYYDHLIGIADRHSLPNILDPDAIITFSKNYKYGMMSTKDVNIDEVEKKLWKQRKEKPRTTELYNQIGNYWRVKGDSLRSVECFRKALSISPNNADVLLNLARLLFNLKYLEDAIYLTRRSLDLVQSDQSASVRNAWMQHFTLGEILRAYGHYHEASLHIRHVLDLNPNYQPALAQLRDMETMPDTTVHIYTLFIIIFLVLGVLCGIILSLNSSLEEFASEVAKQPIQRHFNRAMAMRSLKMGMNMNPRTLRLKKYHA